MRHKHADLIIAWANGAEIEKFNVVSQRWESPYGLNPAWNDEVQYRIKPEPKPDVFEYCHCGHDSLGLTFTQRMHPHNLQLTFDGETGKLKSAEVLK